MKPRAEYNKYDCQNLKQRILIPRNFQTSFHGSPQNFKQVFTKVYESPRLSKEWTGRLSNLEIQIYLK